MLNDRLKSNVHHLVLQAPNWLGDVVMAQPAMLACIASLQAERVSVTGRAWLQDVLPYLDLPHAQYCPDVPTDADASIMFPNSFRAAWMAWRSGCPQRIGFRGQWRRALLSFAPRPRIDLLTQHHRDYYLDLAEQCGMDVQRRRVDLSCPAESLAEGRQMLASMGLDPSLTIAIAAGAQFGGAKRYPAESWAKVAGILSAHGYHILALGTPAERDIAATSLCECIGPSVNSAGKTSLAECLQLLAASRALLCNDSGLMHVAAGLSKAVVAVFGATDPERTAPSGPRVRLLYHPAACSPCLQRECTVSGQPCMANVAPEEIAAACIESLA